MTTEVLAFTPDQNVQEAMQTLVDRGIDGAPVVDGDGVVVGMLSTGDLIVQESQLHFPTVDLVARRHPRAAELEAPLRRRHPEGARLRRSAR